MAKPIKATETLSGKDADKFLKRMLKKEKSKPTKKEKKLSEEIKKNFPEIDKINEITQSKFIELTKWLYNNHREILREWEKTQGNGKVRVEFL